MGRLTATGTVDLVAASVFSSFSYSPTASQKAAVQGFLTTTTTSSTSASTTRPGVTVPNVIGLKIAATRAAMRAVGLAWACYSVGTTTKPPPSTVLNQNPPPGGVLKPGTPVAMTMPPCPQ
jgi:hypothetical protein